MTTAEDWQDGLRVLAGAVFEPLGPQGAAGRCVRSMLRV